MMTIPNRNVVCRASAGSGKTFMLAAYYVALLMKDQSFRSILAVTFTNKATLEMKQRILTYLYAIANHFDHPETQGFVVLVRSIIQNDWQMTAPDAEDMQRRASAAYQAILADYDNLKVMTIDSFLQTLLAGLLQIVGDAAGYHVELDQDAIVRDAVDEMLLHRCYQEDGNRSEVGEMIVARTEKLMEKGKTFDFRPVLIQVACQLYSELVQVKGDRLIVEPKKVTAYQNRIQDWRQFPDCVELSQRLSQRSDYKSIFTDASANAALTRYFTNLENSLYGKLPTNPFCPNMDRLADVFSSEEAYLQALKADKGKNLFEELMQLEQLRKRCLAQYTAVLETQHHLDDMLLLGFVREQIELAMKESNTRLLAETANMLYRALLQGDADFILEKAGIRYHHILLDEFQDTSELQWKDFLKLIDEVLASGGSTLVVGDIKQSIYRFRNGDWHTMHDFGTGKDALLPFFSRKDLSRNFRSRENVVRFNLRLFDDLTRQESAEVRDIYNEHFAEKPLSDFYVQGKHDGGYAEVRLYPLFADAVGRVLTDDWLRKQIVDDMLDTMNCLLDQGAKAQDMMVLVRDRYESALLIRRFIEYKHTYPRTRLSRERMASENYPLSDSISVKAVMAALRYVLLKDTVALQYARLAFPKADYSAIEHLDTHYPLSEMVESIIRLLLCPNGEYEGTDIMYINCFKDQLQAFLSEHGSDGEALLEAWDNEIQNVSVPMPPSGAISILTVHKSKGLQAKHVFVPFCCWPLFRETTAHTEVELWTEAMPVPAVPGQEEAPMGIVPISLSPRLLDTCYADAYLKEKAEQRVDNINLLYVALTRAADNLFVAAPTMMDSLQDEATTVDQFLVRYCPAATPMVDQLTALHPAAVHKELEVVREQLADPDITAADESAYLSYQAELETLWDAVPEDQKSIRQDALFAFYQEGEKPFIVQDTHAHDEELPDPFDFSSNEVALVAPVFRSENRHIKFCQSQNARLNFEQGALTAEQMMASADFGTVCHAVFADIRTADDADYAIRAALIRGDLTSEQVQTVSSSVHRALAAMPDWFDGSWQLMREDAILNPVIVPSQEGEDTIPEIQEKRPDRVMLRGKQAVILDYKFGTAYLALMQKGLSLQEAVRRLYAEQLLGYVDIYSRMGYTEVHAFVWLDDASQCVEITNSQTA